MLHIQLRHNQAVYFSCTFLVLAVTAVKYDENAAEDIRLPSPTDKASLWKDFTVELPSGAVNGLEGLFSPTGLTIPHFSHYYCLCLMIECRVFLFLCSGFYIPGHSVQSPWYKRQVRGASLCTHIRLLWMIWRRLRSAAYLSMWFSTYGSITANSVSQWGRNATVCVLFICWWRHAASKDTHSILNLKLIFDVELTTICHSLCF